MVDGVGVPALHPGHGSPGQAGLQGQHDARVGPGQEGLLPHEREHPGHVVQVLDPDLLGLRFLAGVVVPVREAEAALGELGDVGGAELVVLAHVEAEAGAAALQPGQGQGRGQVLAAADGVDPGQGRLQGLEPGPLDGPGVHAAGVEVAHLLLQAAGGRLGRGRLLQDLLEDEPVAFLHLVEGAPAGLIGRDGVGLDPVAVGVLEKVLAGGDGGVQVGGLDAVDDGSLGAKDRGHEP